MPLPSLYSSLSSFFLKQYRIRLYFDCLKFILSVVRSTLSYCNVVNNIRNPRFWLKNHLRKACIFE